ncbi:MAG: hypothetical protein JSS53_03325, partial [Proteobacteria bacterium]|nr:hypothetical protein [Pseudomonadota bacterium]
MKKPLVTRQQLDSASFYVTAVQGSVVPNAPDFAAFLIVLNATKVNQYAKDLHGNTRQTRKTFEQSIKDNFTKWTEFSFTAAINVGIKPLACFTEKLPGSQRTYFQQHVTEVTCPESLRFENFSGYVAAARKSKRVQKALVNEINKMETNIDTHLFLFSPSTNNESSSSSVVPLTNFLFTVTNPDVSPVVKKRLFEHYTTLIRVSHTKEADEIARAAIKFAEKYPFYTPTVTRTTANTLTFTWEGNSPNSLTPQTLLEILKRSRNTTLWLIKDQEKSPWLPTWVSAFIFPKRSHPLETLGSIEIVSLVKSFAAEPNSYKIINAILGNFLIQSKLGAEGWAKLLLDEKVNTSIRVGETITGRVDHCLALYKQNAQRNTSDFKLKSFDLEIKRYQKQLQSGAELKGKDDQITQEKEKTANLELRIAELQRSIIQIYSKINGNADEITNLTSRIQREEDLTPQLMTQIEDRIQNYDDEVKRLKQLLSDSDQLLAQNIDAEEIVFNSPHLGNSSTRIVTTRLLRSTPMLSGAIIASQASPFVQSALHELRRSKMLSHQENPGDQLQLQPLTPVIAQAPKKNRIPRPYEDYSDVDLMWGENSLDPLLQPMSDPFEEEEEEKRRLAQKEESILELNSLFKSTMLDNSDADFITTVLDPLLQPMSDPEEDEKDDPLLQQMSDPEEDEEDDLLNQQMSDPEEDEEDDLLNQ